MSSGKTARELVGEQAAEVLRVRRHLDHRAVAGGEDAGERAQRQEERIVPRRHDADDALRLRDHAIRAGREQDRRRARCCGFIHFASFFACRGCRRRVVKSSAMQRLFDGAVTEVGVDRVGDRLRVLDQDAIELRRGSRGAPRSAGTDGARYASRCSLKTRCASFSTASNCRSCAVWAMAGTSCGRLGGRILAPFAPPGKPRVRARPYPVACDTNAPLGDPPAASLPPRESVERMLRAPGVVVGARQLSRTVDELVIHETAVARRGKSRVGLDRGEDAGPRDRVRGGPNAAAGVGVEHEELSVPRATAAASRRGRCQVGPSTRTPSSTTSWRRRAWSDPARSRAVKMRLASRPRSKWPKTNGISRPCEGAEHAREIGAEQGRLLVPVEAVDVDVGGARLRAWRQRARRRRSPSTWSTSCRRRRRSGRARSGAARCRTSGEPTTVKRRGRACSRRGSCRA